MKRIELPISKDYVKDWTIHHALREIFQNAIDRETDGMEYQWGHTYDNSLGLLSVYNRHTDLEVKTLLLGTTSKASNDNMIGQFGEGYKLALLVLCRNNIQVEIFTGNEVWSPELGFSEAFQSEVLMINIDTVKTGGTDSLVFKITLQENIWNEYQEYNLNLKDEYEKFETDRGEILLSRNQSRRIYVEGLYICTMKEQFKYGYNFNSNIIELDRDRNSVRPFEVSYHCKELLQEYMKSENAPIKEMLKESRPDIEYLTDNINERTREDLGGSLAEDFIMEHGEYAYPVSNEYDRIEVSERYNGVKTVIVSQKIKKEVIRSDLFQQHKERWDTLPPRKEPHDEVRAFVDDFCTVFENKTAFTEAFEERIFQASKNWTHDN